MHTIDIHSHWYPESYLDALRARDTPPFVRRDGDGTELFVIFEDEEGRPMGEDFTSLDSKLAFMDAQGIDTTVVSLGNPWLDPFSGAEAEAMATAVNEEMAGLEKRTDGRILGMAVLPGGPTESVVRVVQSLMTMPNLYGIIIGSRLCGHQLDHEATEPAWASLEELGLPVFLHPHYGLGAEEFAGVGSGHSLPVGIGFPFETSLAVSRLVLAGFTRRHPNLRLTIAHAGGTLPYLAGRLDAAWRSDEALQAILPVPPSEELARLFVDAIVYHRRTLEAAVDLVGVGHVAYGTDHPFSISDPAVNIAAIASTLTPTEQASVFAEAAISWYRLPEPSSTSGVGTVAGTTE
jgi:aminocarboxymuconate-semialdehyde decarboxylase